MNLALLLQSGFLSSLQEMKRWWHSHHATTQWVPPTLPYVEPVTTPALIARGATPMRAEAQKFALHQPLRVVRVVEVGQPRACVGRMIISGRMADVCAELDRLAARETALS